MPVYSNAGVPHPELYPHWVVKKTGVPLLLESDWPEAAIGSKYGIVNNGLGEGGNVYRDYEHFLGGLGSCYATTGNVIGAATGVQIISPFTNVGLIGFEHRWLPGSTSDWDFGFEWDVRARMRYVGATGEWMYESDADTFTGFDMPVTVSKPSIAQTGDRWGWARLVIDLEAERYVSFEAAGQDKKLHFRDMASIRLPDPLLGVGPFDFKIFAIATARAASNQTSYTTNWCVSRLD